MVDTSLIERIIAEGAMGCAEAARLFGTFRSGRPCHPATISRWCISGVRVRDGRRVKLEHFRGAGKLLTSKPAIFRFLAAQQEPVESAEPATIPLPTPTERRRAIEAATREMEAAGA